MLDIVLDDVLGDLIVHGGVLAVEEVGRPQHRRYKRRVLQHDRFKNFLMKENTVNLFWALERTMKKLSL
jgi:hypothetical protein